MSDLSAYLANAKQDRSIDDIAEAARRGGHEVSRSVVAKYLRGEHGRRPPESTLAGLAAGFGVDVRVLRRLAGRAPGELGPYVPTEEASSLTQQQRDAINQLIKAFMNEGGSVMLATLRLRRHPTRHRPRATRRTCSTCATKQSGWRSRTISPWPHAGHVSLER